MIDTLRLTAEEALGLLERALDGLAGAADRDVVDWLGVAEAVRVGVRLGDALGRGAVETTGAHSPRG